MGQSVRATLTSGVLKVTNAVDPAELVGPVSWRRARPLTQILGASSTLQTFGSQVIWTW